MIHKNQLRRWPPDQWRASFRRPPADIPGQEYEAMGANGCVSVIRPRRYLGQTRAGAKAN